MTPKAGPSGPPVARARQRVGNHDRERKLVHLNHLFLSNTLTSPMFAQTGGVIIGHANSRTRVVGSGEEYSLGVPSAV